MNECDSLFVVEVRVGVDISLVAMRCPPSMPDSNTVIMQSGPISRYSLDAVTSETICGCKFCAHESCLTLFVFFY